MGLLTNLLRAKNSKADARAKELYRLIIEYSKIKSVNELEVIAVNDSNGDSGLSNLLEYCAILYQPENYTYYAVFDAKENVSEQKGTIIPVWYPQSYRELVDNCTSLCYGMMSGCLSGHERYLAYPQFDEMEKRIDQLCLEECMQYFLFYNRLSLRYGQQYFFEKWKDGTTLRVVKRMQHHQKNS